MTAAPPTAEDVINAPGAWTHRNVSANGSRFHIVELGAGPVVLFLHGFPAFWWTWRQSLAPIAALGYRAIAMDIRGYGGSDHPPQGYDPTTFASDCASVLRSLGEKNAIIVGQGIGGIIAWTMAAQTPDITRAIVTVAAPHPRILRSSVIRSNSQRGALNYLLRMQLPFVPERHYSARGGERVGDFFERNSHDPSWFTPEIRQTYQLAYRSWPTAHTAIEFHRWSLRSLYRNDGRQYQESVSHPITVPVLEILGEKDPLILAGKNDSSEMVSGPYTRAFMPTGHFPHEENPKAFNDIVAQWLNGL